MKLVSFGAVARRGSDRLSTGPGRVSSRRRGRSPGRQPTSRRPRSFSLQRAADYLDETAVQWTRQHKCGSCHTNYPYLMSRPALKEFASPATGRGPRVLREEGRPLGRRKAGSKPKWDAEVVSTAEALAIRATR